MKTRYWAWYDNTKNIFHHIYPKKVCVELCSPDGFTRAIKRKEGKIVEVEIVEVKKEQHEKM